VTKTEIIPGKKKLHGFRASVFVVQQPCLIYNSVTLSASHIV